MLILAMITVAASAARTQGGPRLASIAAPLERCAELLGLDLATIRELAAEVEPYVRADGTRIWSLMQLERQLRPDAYGWRRDGYLDRRRNPMVDTWGLDVEFGRTAVRGTERTRCP
jgi:hypothetical protein